MESQLKLNHVEWKVEVVKAILCHPDKLCHQGAAAHGAKAVWPSYIYISLFHLKELLKTQLFGCCLTDESILQNIVRIVFQEAERKIPYLRGNFQ